MENTEAKKTILDIGRWDENKFNNNIFALNLSGYDNEIFRIFFRNENKEMKGVDLKVEDLIKSKVLDLEKLTELIYKNNIYDV